MVATLNYHSVTKIQWVSHGLVPAEDMDRQSPAPCLPSHPTWSFLHSWSQLQPPPPSPAPRLFAGIFLPGLQMQGEASVAEMHYPSTALPARCWITTLAQSTHSPPGMESAMQWEKRHIKSCFQIFACSLWYPVTACTTVDGRTSFLLLPQCSNP